MDTPDRYRVNTSSFAHYWSAGIGLDLLDTLGFRPRLKDAVRFVPYLFRADPLGDELVGELHAKRGFATGQQLLDSYLRGSSDIPQTERMLLDRFMAGLEPEPDWLDRQLLDQGIAFSQRSGISGLIVLRDYCLMGGYESAAINKPLIYTGALRKGPVKRLAETVEFWVDVTGKDALRKGYVGFLAVLKTRMIHSFARLKILDSTDWDSSKWGVPLNAWDMLATNLGFSLVYLTGLKIMGFKTVDREVEGLFHLWKYIGYLLGIPLELLPDSEKQAIEALYYWTMTQPDGDDDSRTMALALQDESLIAHYPKKRLGRYLMREIHLFYNHFLLGAHSCKLLGLDSTVLGKLAWANIWRNRWENQHVEDEKHRQRLVIKGRKVHERVRQIYLDAPSVPYAPLHDSH